MSNGGLPKYIKIIVSTTFFDIIQSFFKKKKKRSKTSLLASFPVRFFKKKLFLTLYFISWPNFIAWLCLLLEILDNICTVIICFQVCDFINFEIRPRKPDLLLCANTRMLKNLAQEPTLLTFSCMKPIYLNSSKIWKRYFRGYSVHSIFSTERSKVSWLATNDINPPINPASNVQWIIYLRLMNRVFLLRWNLFIKSPPLWT